MKYAFDVPFFAWSGLKRKVKINSESQIHKKFIENKQDEMYSIVTHYETLSDGISMYFHA